MMNHQIAAQTPTRPKPPIEALRAQVRRLESRAAAGRGPVLPLGLPPLDRQLPGGGLPLSCLHLFEGARGEWDDGAVTGFCLALLSRLLAARPGRVLWISPWRDLYAPGLASQGLDPDRFLLLRTRDEGEALWALEEGLRCRDLLAVVGELEGLPRHAARRLQLVAEAGGVTALLIARGLVPRRRERETTSATTRWSVSTAGDDAPPRVPPARLMPRPCWDVELLRCRGAAPGRWRLAWHEDGSLRAADDVRSKDEEPKDKEPKDKEKDHAAHAVPLAAALRRGAVASAAGQGSGSASGPWAA